MAPTMLLLHNIKDGPTTNYDSRERVEAYLKEHLDAPISFDGVYASVWENRDLLTGREVILFVVGAHVGGNNAWDTAQPLETFCAWWQLLDLALNYGCEIAWHTWNHSDLTAVDDRTLGDEVTPPFPMKTFAYPYGKYDQRVVEAVKRAGFERAYSTNRGDGTPFALKRHHL